MITPTEHEKSEWSRFAQAAYKAGRNDLGHRFSMAAACTLKGQAIDGERFYALQDIYRDWLCFNRFPIK